MVAALIPFSTTELAQRAGARYRRSRRRAARRPDRAAGAAAGRRSRARPPSAGGRPRPTAVGSSQLPKLMNPPAGSPRAWSTVGPIRRDLGGSDDPAYDCVATTATARAVTARRDAPATVGGLLLEPPHVMQASRCSSGATGRRPVSYPELGSIGAEIARGLIGLGIEPGDRVAILGLTSADGRSPTAARSAPARSWRRSTTPTPRGMRIRPRATRVREWSSARTPLRRPRSSRCAIVALSSSRSSCSRTPATAR